MPAASFELISEMSVRLRLAQTCVASFGEKFFMRDDARLLCTGEVMALPFLDFVSSAVDHKSFVVCVSRQSETSPNVNTHTHAYVVYWPLSACLGIGSTTPTLDTRPCERERGT